jgi:UDP-glucose 4-epimerase
MLVLIGGNGFVGRHLTIEAVRRGLDVTVVAPRPDEAFLAKYAPSARSLDLDAFEGKPGESLISDARAIVCLAARSVPATHIHNPVAELDVNVGPAFSTFLRISRTNPAAKVVLLSSGGTVYGKVQGESAGEGHALRPISPYGLGKVMTEQALMFCADAWQQSCAILRASNPVGRWHTNLRQGLVPAVLRSIREGAPLVIYGNGGAVRDYLDADDLADAILHAAHDERSGTSVWNVGSGVGTSVAEIIDIVSSIAGGRPNVEFRESRPVDVDRIVLNCSKIAQDLGWKAVTSLPTSIQKIVMA